MKWWRSLVLFCLCAFLAVSCGQSTPTASPDGRIVLGTTATISTIDPADASSSFASMLLYNLSDRLYTYKLGTNDLEPQLATALPKVSADGLTYTIPLRQGVVFHDGTPFNAEAMAFSLNRLRENKGSAPVRLSEVEAVTASGEYELTIKLEKPFTAFPTLLTFTGACAVSPKAYKIEADAFQPKEFVGTGPYKLTKFGTDRIRMEAFDQYWGGKPANPGVDIQLLSGGANLYNSFRTGSIDLAIQGLAIEQIRNLRDDAENRGWQMIEQPGGSISVLVPNLRSAPLDKLEVRQALAAAVDRPLLQSRVFAGQIDPLYSLLPNHMKGQKPVFQAAYGDGKFEQAKARLQAAGFSTQNPAVIELWYRSNITNDQLAALTLKALIKKNLGDILKIELNSVESTTAYNRLEQGVYPTFILDWSGDYFDPDTYLYPFLECSKGNAETLCESGQSAAWGSFYFSDQANQLLAASRQEQDPAKRQKLLEQLQQIVATEVPFIPMWQGKDYLFVQKGITGASLEVTQKVPFWKLKKAS
ncbi:ABC transporter substrate-binding protein [Romeriopsis navalis]|nr:ABC transporter substrate-binding protein [Romeriopsis navalis]